MTLSLHHRRDHDSPIIRPVSGNPRSAARDQFDIDPVVLIEYHVDRRIMVIIRFDIGHDEVEQGPYGLKNESPIRGNPV